MKIIKILAIAALIATTPANSVFAVTQNTAGNSMSFEQKTAPGNKLVRKSFDKPWDANFDPVKALENRKAKILQRVKEGKLTQEQAKNITAKIDARIKEVKEFDRLSTDRKKAKLKSNFKTFIDTKVKNGRLTQEKADEMTVKFTEKINNWDGKGYPFFVFRGICKPHTDGQCK